MNAFTIYNYITKLEKENNNLRNEIDELRQAIRFLNSLETVEDSESVASRKDLDSTLTADDTGTDSDSESEEDAESVAESEEDAESEDSESEEDAESVAESEEDAESEDSESEEDAESVAESEEDAESVAESEDSEQSGVEVTSDHYLPNVTNTELTRMFYRLARKEDNEFKKKAYTRAARVIEDFPTELTSSSEIAHIMGIGKGIRKLVDEYLGLRS